MAQSNPVLEITVVVATCNRSEGLRNTLRSLAESRVSPSVSWEVLIVDNNSTDSTRSVAESFTGADQPNFRYLFEPQQGKSFALNRGIEEARGRIVAMTDDDCIVDSQWVASILREYASDPDLAVVGGRVERSSPVDEPTAVRMSKQRIVVSLGPFEPSAAPIIGCNVAFKREVLAAVGCFDPDFGPGSSHRLVAEDVDFLYRICKRGFKTLYSPDVLVYHNHGRRMGADWESVCRSYVRGRGAFYCKHLLNRDGAVLKMAYWEALGATKRLVQKFFAGNAAGRELALLWNLGVGAMYEFRACSPRIFQSMISRT